MRHTSEAFVRDADGNDLRRAQPANALDLKKMGILSGQCLSDSLEDAGAVIKGKGYECFPPAGELAQGNGCASQHNLLLERERHRTVIDYAKRDFDPLEHVAHIDQQ